MANFSTNQVKQLYVAKDLNTSPAQVGDIAFLAAGDNQIAAKYYGNDGKVRTDLINLATLKGKAIKASTMSQYLDSAYIGSSSAVAGQQYILQVTIDEFGGISPEDKGFIFADYQATNSDTAADILAGVAINLALNAEKAAYSPLINVYVTTVTNPLTTALVVNTNAWKVNADDAKSTVAAHTPVAIVIEAAAQPYKQGKMPFSMLHFKVSTDASIKAGDADTRWGDIKYNVAHPSAAIVNTNKIADLEFFCAGERGDIYRGMGYPNNFDFDSIVAATSAPYGYHILELTWAYQGNAEDIQKSPKELVIVVPAEGATTYTAINKIIGTASSGASAGTLNKAIYDSGSSAFIAQLS